MDETDEGALPAPEASFSELDHAMMRLAMDQALNAQLHGEVPVGAVLVKAGQVIATGYNHPIGSHDPTAHAEIRTLRMAAEQLGNYRVGESTLYVTLEPCMMCLGAMLHARISRVVFGASDPKTGVCGGVLDLPAEGRLNHQTVVQGGLLADECGKLLQRFFVERRAQRRADRAALRAQQDELARWAASLPAEEEAGTLHLDVAGNLKG
ncbi:MAG: tRNA adenosine(34) deaminase TadA [Lautropia mirabilis]